MTDTNLKEPTSVLQDLDDLKVKTPKFFGKNTETGNFIRKTLKVGIFVGVPLSLILAILYYIFIFLSPRAIIYRSIKNLKKVESARYSAELTLDFSEIGNPNSSKEIGVEILLH